MLKGLHIFILFATFSTGFSQKIVTDYHLKHTIRQDKQQFEFTVLDFDDKGVYDYNKGKIYHWLKAQKVHATQGYSSGLLLDGEFQAFYESKQLARRGYFFKGLKNGEWLYWNENGVLIQIEHWKSGIKCGTEKIFDQNGVLISKIKYKGNKIERRTQDSLIVENSVTTSKKIVVYDDRNRKTKVIRLKYSELNGKQESFVNGKLDKVECFKDGKVYVKTPLKERFKNIFKKDKSTEKKDKKNSDKTTKEKKSTKEKVKSSKEKDSKKKNSDNTSKKKWKLFSKEKKTNAKS